MLPVHLNSTTVAVDLPASDFFIKDGRKIHIGDCALFMPPQDSLPFIGKIYKVKAGKENSLSLVVNWLYRPADVKLAKGISVEAAPNEVFYSFRKDEIPASSLLHPCRVAFLRKGVELPLGISSLVCRRVYDIDGKCLWWLTDKNYINERKEEVDKLLHRTRLEMHAVLQSEGRSPKSLNGPTVSPQSKSGSDSIQNSSSFSSQVKEKKRDRVDQGSEITKRERLTKTEDGDSDQKRPENMLKCEIAKITDRGGLVDFEGVEKLVKFMQPDSADKKIDLAGRVMLVDVIAVTDRFDCLGWFLQLRGLPVLDEWLQDVHKAKIGYGSSPKESDKSVEEFLLALLRALDKLPVNLNALQTCNVGKSVNHLRTHKNTEIQRKARGLVDTWKRKVEAEMNMNDGKSGLRHGVSWPTKSLSTEASNVANRKAGGGSNEVGTKSSMAQPPGSRNPQVRLGTTETVVKSSLSPGANKPTASCGISSKDHNLRVLTNTGTSDLPLPPIKEERSSSSSQSQNNSQSSGHAKTLGSSLREDARSSSAGSGSVTKVSTGGTRHRKSSNGIQGTAVSGVKKETVSRKVNASNRKLTAEKAATDGASCGKSPDFPHVDYGNGSLIVKLPNSSRSPARVSIGGSENPIILCGRDLPAEKPDNHDKRVKGSNDALEANIACNSKERLAGSEEGCKLFPGDEQDRAVEEGEMPLETSKVNISLAGTFARSGKPYGASLSSMNALVESCVKFSENGASTYPGDDGMILLASVAAGVSKSDNVSPLHSPGGNSPIAEESSSGNSGRLKQLGEEVATQCQAHGGGSCTTSEQVSGDLLQSRKETRYPITPISANSDDDRKGLVGGDLLQSRKEKKCSITHMSAKTDDDRIGLIAPSEKPRDSSVKLKSSLDLQQNVDSPPLGSDGKPDEVPHDTTAVLTSSYSGKEGNIEAEGAKQFPDQIDLKKSGLHKIKNSQISESESKVTTSLYEEVKKVDCANERILDNCVAVGLETTAISTKAEKDFNEDSACLSSEVDVEKQNTFKKSSLSIVMEKKPSVVTESHSNSIEEKRVDVTLLPCSGNPLDVESEAEKVNDVKTVSHDEPSEREKMTLDPIASNKKDDYAKENLEGKVGIVLCSSAPIPHVVHPIPVKENGQSEKSSGCKVDRIGSEITEEKDVSNAYLPPAAGSDSAVKLDFDLNEGFPVDDGCQGEFVRATDPGASSAIKLPCQLPFSVSSMSCSYSASITVASAAKGPVVPPENTTRSGAGHGWKGSAATSAFRPAETRRNLEMPLRTSDLPVMDNITTSKECHSLLDFDLNVPDQRVLDDLASRSAARATYSESRFRDGGAGGLDLDLNRLDESSDVGPLSNGLVNVSRDFDLNNGPCLDDVSSETSLSQQNKYPMPLPSPFPGTRVNPMEFRNISSWFSSGNSYSTMAPITSVFPGRGNQSYVSAAGSQRFLAPTGTSSFAPEIYRGSMISSSHAVAFSPTPFQYPGFPFETNFPLSSNSFSGSSTAYMDSSSGGALCFPTIPSQLIGPAGVVPSPFPRPYIVSVPGPTNVGPDGGKWGVQGLDLNAGPLGTDTERREDRLSSGLRQFSIPSLQPVANEQLNLFQVGVLKRKEPDSGLDAAARFSYNKPSWQ